MTEANHIALSEFFGWLDQCLPARAVEAFFNVDSIFGSVSLPMRRPFN